MIRQESGPFGGPKQRSRAPDILSIVGQFITFQRYPVATSSSVALKLHNMRGDGWRQTASHKNSDSSLLRDHPHRTSAVNGVFTAADKCIDKLCNVTVTRGGGIKKSIHFADVIYEWCLSKHRRNRRETIIPPAQLIWLGDGRDVVRVSRSLPNCVVPWLVRGKIFSTSSSF